MPKRKIRLLCTHMSDVERAQIIHLFQMEASYSEITWKTGYSVISVQRVIIQWTQQSSRTHRPGTGLRTRTTPREDCQIVCTAFADRRMAVAQIRTTTAVTITRKRILNRLLEDGLQSRTPMQCTSLNRFHCQVR